MAYLEQQMNIQQVAAGKYQLSCHPDWSVGVTMFGGCVAAQLYHAASTHITTDPAVKKLNQPDIMTLHVEYLRPCFIQDSIITVSVLKSGKTATNLQLQLHQDDQLKALALATTTNFDISLGPTVPNILTMNNMHPPPYPTPDFEAAEAGTPLRDWLPCYYTGDVSRVVGNLLVLRPRPNYTVQGFADGWHRFNKPEQIDSTSLTFLGDFIPSMSQTLLQTGSPSDVKAFTDRARVWSEKNPGVPAVITHTLEQAMKSETLDSMLTMTYEFKRRLPKNGIDWAYYRLNTNMLEKGRMDVHLSIFDKEYNLLCTCKHLVLVLESARKFTKGSNKASL